MRTTGWTTCSWWANTDGPANAADDEPAAYHNEAEWVGFPSPSPGAAERNDDLQGLLQQQHWSWQGRCGQCHETFARGSVAGLCERSRPQPLHGVVFRNDLELVQLMDNLGAISFMVYLWEVRWPRNAGATPPGANSQEAESASSSCPRCRGFSSWSKKWSKDHTQRQMYVTASICRGFTEDLALEETKQLGVPTDILISRRFRELVRQIRRCIRECAPPCTIAIVVPSGPLCYFLWHLLSVLHPAWRTLSGAEAHPKLLPGLPPHDAGRAFWRRPSAAMTRHICVRIDVSAMKASEVQAASRLVKERQTPVVVLCADCRQANTQLPDLGAISHLLVWDRWTHLPEGLISASTKKVTFWKDPHMDSIQASRDALLAPPGLEAAGDMDTLGGIGVRLSAVAEAPLLPATTSSATPALVAPSPITGELLCRTTDGQSGGGPCARTSVAPSSARPSASFLRAISGQSGGGPCPSGLAPGGAVGGAGGPASWGDVVERRRAPDPVATLEQVWLAACPDSYAIAALREQGGVAAVLPVDATTKRDGTGLVARVRPLGHLTPFEPDVQAERPVADDARAFAVGQGLQLAMQRKLLEKSGEAAESLAALFRRFMPSKPLMPSSLVPRPLQLHDRGQQKPLGMQDALSFSKVHNVDLSDPTVTWPSEMRILRIEHAQASAAPCMEQFGLLVAPGMDEGVHYGFSTEWNRGLADHAVVRLTPTVIPWHSMRTAPGSPTKEKPEALLRRYHEAILHKFASTCQAPSHAAGMTAALVVRLVPESRPGVVRLAWPEMTETVWRHRERITWQLMSTLGSDDADADAQEEGRGDIADSSPAVSGRGSRTSQATREEDSLASVPTPSWWPSLLHRSYRLLDLERAGCKFGPVFPALSPLVLEAVLTAPTAGLKDMPFDCYRALGSKVLRVLLAMTAHCRTVSPAPAADHHLHFAKTLAELLPREKLAESFAHFLPPSLLQAATGAPHMRLPSPDSSFPREDNRQHEVEVAAGIAEAFVGAYFFSMGQDGNFFSAWQFLLWLQQGKEVEAPWVHAAMAHLLFDHHHRYRGRTPSYSEFREEWAPAWTEKILRVHYCCESQCPYWVTYRRPRPGFGGNGPMERHDGKDWRPLLYSNAQHTFVSADGTLVPNKVCRWMLGRPIASLTAAKPYTAKTIQARTSPGSGDGTAVSTPDYEQLHETQNDLRVKYREHGWFVYKRSHDGNLGTEREEGHARVPGSSETSLSFSENLKTLRCMAPCLQQRPLPNKIMEWLHHQKCIAFIVTPTRRETDAGKTIDALCSVDTPQETKVRWSYGADAFECRMETVPGGILFVEYHAQTGDRQPLIYSEETKTWLSPTLTARFQTSEKKWSSGVPVPAQVFDWLKQTVQRALRELGDASGFREHYFTTPWCAVPHFVKTMVPRGTDLPNLEGPILQYCFDNPMLLVEALTHASYPRATSPPNIRLAILGGGLMELFLTQELIRRLRIPMHETWQPEPKGCKLVGNTFAMSAAKGDPFPSFPPVAHPRAVGSTSNSFVARGHQRLECSAKLLEWINACCNHVTYGYVCCKSQIHKHMLFDTAGHHGLAEGIRKFSKIAKKAAKAGKKEFWQTLSVHDAPRLMGDTLLAIMAAVFLDSDWTNCASVFRQFFEKHFFDVLENCHAVADDESPVVDPVADLRRLADNEGLTVDIRPVLRPTLPGPIGRIVCDALASSCRPDEFDHTRGLAFCSLALATLPAGRPQFFHGHSTERPAAAQCEVAFNLPDFNFCRLCLSGHAIGPPVGGTSPRSATRRCAALVLHDGGGLTLEALRVVKAALDCSQMEGIEGRLLDMQVLRPVGGRLNTGSQCVHLAVPTPFHVQANLSPDVSDTSSDPGENADASPTKMPRGDGAEVWCHDCRVWLNGTTQWEDHKIGKKHRRNTQKKTLEGSSALSRGGLV